MAETPIGGIASSIRACGLPASVADGLAAAGLDVGGVLEIAVYDGLVPHAWRSAARLPDARSAVVIGSVGARLAATLDAAGVGPDPHGDPIDGWVRRTVESACQEIRQQGGHAWAGFAFDSQPDPAGGGARFADFVALARAGGLGVPGRLRLLMHPVYGPWLALRACLLTSLPLVPTAPLSDFDPCTRCPAPCAEACPGQAVAPAGLELDRCVATRLRVAACARDCAARRACVIGPENAPPAAWLAHHAHHSLRFLSTDEGGAASNRP